MKAHPKTTYVLASPQTWELARAAYLSGLSAPAVAARFGLGVSGLRKRALREGWTKRAYAQALDPALSRAPAGAGACAPAIARGPAQASARPRAGEAGSWEDDPLERALPPIRFQPAAVARLALARAARALEEDRPLEAREHARAAEAIMRLDEVVPSDDEIETFEEAEWRHSALRAGIWELAREMAQALAAGEAVPAEYSQEAAAWRRARGC